MAESGTITLGSGYRDHGVATPVSNHRGTVATVDGEGRCVALVWLFDHRGGYALLMIDAETGKAEQFAMPFSDGNCPFASILSSRNRFYTHFGDHFVEFDPAKRAFTFSGKTSAGMAMSMTEDDAGRIWAASYPNSGVVCYDPASGELRDYGHVYAQNWPQYQRSLAADDTGWIYFAVGNTASQIIALDPQSGKAAPLLADDQRKQGTAALYRDMDGRVYAAALAGDDAHWLALHGGEATRIDKPAAPREKPIITGSQGLFHRAFPDGRLLKTCDLATRTIAIEDPKTGSVIESAFDYTSDGAHLMGLCDAPDGTIVGGTAFPMNGFVYEPAKDKWTSRPALGQWNTIANAGDRMFIGAYIHGMLIEWDTTAPWTPTTQKSGPEKDKCNPRFITECEPTINRPHCLLVHPDGKHIVLAGTPGYGYTGGGLLIYNRQTGEHTLLKHTDLLPEHSTMSLVALADGNLLCGSTIGAGTGGEVKAKQAELYVLDLKTRRIIWHEPIVPGTPEYTAMAMSPAGVVYGIVAGERFIVFDPQARKVVHSADIKADFGGAGYQQGPRRIVFDDKGIGYLLLSKGIVRIDPETWALKLMAESPVPVGPGGTYLSGRIYFASASHLYSYELP